MAFALWQGEESQRDGNKRVSHGWIMVNVRPAPPPTPPSVQNRQRPKQSAEAKRKDAKGVKSENVPAAGTFY